MTCGDKTKNNCGKKVYAECTYYEGTLPEWSELEDCKTVEETTEELYSKLTELIDMLDFSDTESSCEDLTIKEEGGKVTLKSYLETLLEIAEGIKCGEITIKEDVDISKWGLDLKCLIEPCDTPIAKLSTLIQVMITKMCECCLEAGGGETEIRFGAGIPEGSPSVGNPQRVYLRDNGELYVWFTTGTPGWLEIGLVNINFNKGQFATDSDLADQGAFIRKVTPSTDIPGKNFVFTPEFVNGIKTLITPSTGFLNGGTLNSTGAFFQRRWDNMVDLGGIISVEGGFLSSVHLPSPTYKLSNLDSQVLTLPTNRVLLFTGHCTVIDNFAGAGAGQGVYQCVYYIIPTGNAGLITAGTMSAQGAGLYVQITDLQYETDLTAKAVTTLPTDAYFDEVYFYLDLIKYYI